MVAGTAPPSASTDASYIAAPTTLLAKPSDIASVTTTGTGVRLVLQGQVPTPPLGAGVVLPISSELPGGFLGVVTAVSADGRTLDLEAGGLADAFDYYELSVEEFSADLEPAAEAQASAAAAAAADDTCKPSATTLGGHFKTKVDKYSVFGAEVPVGASLDMGLTAKVVGKAEIKTDAAYKCALPLGKLAKTLGPYSPHRTPASMPAPRPRRSSPAASV